MTSTRQVSLISDLLEKIIIHILLGPDEIRKFYFSGNNDNWLFNSFTRRAVLNLGLVIIGAILYNYRGYDLLVIKVILVAFLLYFLYRFRLYYIWRKQMEFMIQEMKDAGEYLLEITNSGFILSNDQWQVTEMFSSIRHLKINEDAISFSAAQNYSFPRKSMTEQDYILLSKILEERVKPS